MMYRWSAMDGMMIWLFFSESRNDKLGQCIAFISTGKDFPMLFHNLRNIYVFMFVTNSIYIYTYIYIIHILKMIHNGIIYGAFYFKILKLIMLS